MRLVQPMNIFKDIIIVVYYARSSTEYINTKMQTHKNSRKKIKQWK